MPSSAHARISRLVAEDHEPRQVTERAHADARDAEAPQPVLGDVDLRDPLGAGASAVLGLCGGTGWVRAGIDAGLARSGAIRHRELS